MSLEVILAISSMRRVRIRASDREIDRARLPRRKPEPTSKKKRISCIPMRHVHLTCILISLTSSLSRSQLHEQQQQQHQQHQQQQQQRQQELAAAHALVQQLQQQLQNAGASQSQSAPQEPSPPVATTQQLPSASPPAEQEEPTPPLTHTAQVVPRAEPQAAGIRRRRSRRRRRRDQPRTYGPARRQRPRSFMAVRNRSDRYAFRKFPCERIPLNVSLTGSSKFRQDSTGNLLNFVGNSLFPSDWNPSARKWSVFDGTDRNRQKMRRIQPSY